MRVRWTRRALVDVERLSDFLATNDPGAAARAETALLAAPKSLAEFPRRGRRLVRYRSREVRELLIGRYVMRYEIKGDGLMIVRFFHGREHR